MGSVRGLMALTFVLTYSALFVLLELHSRCGRAPAAGGSSLLHCTV